MHCGTDIGMYRPAGFSKWSINMIGLFFHYRRMCLIVVGHPCPCPYVHNPYTHRSLIAVPSPSSWPRSVHRFIVSFVVSLQSMLGALGVDTRPTEPVRSNRILVVHSGSTPTNQTSTDTASIHQLQEGLAFSVSSRQGSNVLSKIRFSWSKKRYAQCS